MRVARDKEGYCDSGKSNSDEGDGRATVMRVMVTAKATMATAAVAAAVVATATAMVTAMAAATTTER